MPRAQMRDLIRRHVPKVVDPKRSEAARRGKETARQNKKAKKAADHRKYLENYEKKAAEYEAAERETPEGIERRLAREARESNPVNIERRKAKAALAAQMDAYNEEIDRLNRGGAGRIPKLN